MTLTAYLSKVLNKKPEEHQDLRAPVAWLAAASAASRTTTRSWRRPTAPRKSAGPVKLIQTRESKFATSFPRTPTYHKLKAGLKNGQLVAMNHDICCGWMGAALLRR